MALNYDTIIIELQSNGKASASISIKKVDLEILQNSHNATRSQIIEDMIQTMEQGKDENEGFSVREPIGFSTLPTLGAEERGVEKTRSFIDLTELRSLKSTNDDILNICDNLYLCSILNLQVFKPSMEVFHRCNQAKLGEIDGR